MKQLIKYEICPLVNQKDITQIVYRLTDEQMKEQIEWCIIFRIRILFRKYIKVCLSGSFFLSIIDYYMYANQILPPKAGRYALQQTRS